MVTDDNHGWTPSVPAADFSQFKKRNLALPNLETSDREVEQLRLKWGHTVLDPDGNEIQVPAIALVKLRRLGVLLKRRGPTQISAAIYKFFEPDCEALLDGLRRLLGEDISGPEWVRCPCKPCVRERDLIQREFEHLGLFQLDMAIQRNAHK